MRVLSYELRAWVTSHEFRVTGLGLNVCRILIGMFLKFYHINRRFTSSSHAWLIFEDRAILIEIFQE